MSPVKESFLGRWSSEVNKLGLNDTQIVRNGVLTVRVGDFDISAEVESSVGVERGILSIKPWRFSSLSVDIEKQGNITAIEVEVNRNVIAEIYQSAPVSLLENGEEVLRVEYISSDGRDLNGDPVPRNPAPPIKELLAEAPLPRAK